MMQQMFQPAAHTLNFRCTWTTRKEGYNRHVCDLTHKQKYISHVSSRMRLMSGSTHVRKTSTQSWEKPKEVYDSETARLPDEKQNKRYRNQVRAAMPNESKDRGDVVLICITYSSSGAHAMCPRSSRISHCAVILVHMHARGTICM